MKNSYAALSGAFLLIGLGATAQSLKPGIHPHPERVHLRGGGAPANDECSGAIPLTVGTECVPTNGNSATATQSMDPAAEGCGTTFVSPDAFDTWYSFVASGNMTNVDVTGISTYDAVVQIFSGDCGNLVPVACSDVNFPTDPPVGNMTESATVETTPGTTYYARVYYYSSPLPVDFDYTICVYGTPASTEYCIPSVTETCDEYVANVAIGTLSYASDCTEGGYVDYTEQNFALAAGSSTPITVTNGPNFYASDAVSVWGDWNHDLVFSGSELSTLSSDDEGATFSGTVDVPAGALDGNTRFRVRMVYNADPLPCGETSYGETEDYTVNVTGGVSGINDRPAPLAFSIYPNPTNGTLNLTYADVSGTVNIELMDMTGRVVMAEQRLLNQGQNTTIDLAGKAAAGNYALRLTSAHGRSALPVMVR